MSQSQVVAVDLDTFERTLEAPLTLDADQAINPSNAELSNDGYFDGEKISLVHILFKAFSIEILSEDKIIEFFLISFIAFLYEIILKI